MEFDFYQFEHFGLSEYAKMEEGSNFNFREHLHHSFELLTVCEGEMEIIVDNKEYQLNTNESVLIFPNQIHSISSTTSKHRLWIFSSELVKAYTSKISGKIPADNRFSPNGYLLDLLAKINDDTTIVEKKGMFYSICAEFDKNAEYVKRTYENKKLLYEIFKFVESNFNGDCSLNTLAKETGFSYTYLSSYFKKIVGVSYNNYVNQYRISNACYLLSNTDYNILQCALESGFDSLRSFNRNFYTCVSITPTQYREKSKNSCD